MRYDDILAAIGHTPLVELTKMSPKPEVRLFAKLEGQNPTGSVKERIAHSMIEQAEESGELTHEKAILEPTSGNTGIALAMVGRLKGYRVVAVMPDNVTEERRQLLTLYGAEIISSDGRKGSNGAIELAMELARDRRYYMPFQYGNQANPQAHYETTGVEILEDLPDVDVFVAGLGTGGTLMGVARRLKEHNANIQVIAAEPLPGEQVQGLRSLEEGFIPPILDPRMLDRRILVSTRDAVKALRELTNREGIFAGVSSGAIVHCAIRVAQQLPKGNIVALLPDGGWKYLSAGLWTRSLANLESELEGKVWW
ncbi:MAG: cysteine synthase [Chloroflexi bacterium]|nr:cysteine synthase [Chloroflexota bacterium]